MNLRRRIRKTWVMLAPIAIVPAALASADALTWTATAPGSLTDPANWTASTIPSTADSVTFAAADWPRASLPGDLTVQSVSVTDGQGTLDLAAHALHVIGPVIYNSANVNSCLTITGGTLSAGSLTVAGGAPQWLPIPTLTLHADTTVAGPVTLGTAADPATSGGVLVETWAPLTVAGPLTIGAGSYARLNAFAPVSASSLSAASNFGGANASFWSSLTVAGDVHLGDTTAGTNATFGGVTHIGGSLTVGAPNSATPDYWSSNNALDQGTPDLTVDGDLTIYPTAELDLSGGADGVTRAARLVNAGKIVGWSGRVAANSLVNHGILEPHTTVIDAPYAQTPDANLYFLIRLYDDDSWHLTLNQSVDWQGGTIHVVLCNGWTPSPGDRLDLISANAPLPITPTDVRFDTLSTLAEVSLDTPYSLDTSHGLSIVFVPEPTGALAAAAGLTTSLLRRRRGKCRPVARSGRAVLVAPSSGADSPNPPSPA